MGERERKKAEKEGRKEGREKMEVREGGGRKKNYEYKSPWITFAFILMQS